MVDLQKACKYERNLKIGFKLTGCFSAKYTVKEDAAYLASEIEKIRLSKNKF